MWRTILGLFAAMLVAALLMLCIEGAATTLFPPADGPPRNAAELARLLATAPWELKAMVVFGWALASLAGGWVAAKIARHPRVAAWITGLLVVAGCVLNAVSIPHPTWMNALGVLLPVPLALLGARLARRRPVAPA